MSAKLPISGTPVAVEFDPSQVRERYAREREARLKGETLEQFQGLSDVLELDSSDPWSEPVQREPVTEDLEVVVLGGGFGGLLAGAYLTKNNVTDFRIVEQAGDFGGTWYWNRYPGVQCDVESFVYLPLLEETGYIPTKRYADGAEIFEHAQRIGRHYDLYRTALFQTSVTSVTWLDDEEQWEVSTDRGDVLRARFVLRANGPLNKPQVPRVPGINEFTGKIFHTSRWDYDYTGGSAAGDLEKLRDKRVAIIGTGATGVQAVPFLAEDAKELFVVQRTPSVVGPRDNRPTDPTWAAGLEEGWQRERHHNFLSFLNGHHQDEDLVDDIWTHLFPSLNGQHLIDVPAAELPVEDQMALAELADMKLMYDIHQHIDSQVKDPDTARKLKPWFGFVCKRPAFNDDYLPAFNKPSVHLVSAPTGVDGITATGLVVDGRHHEVDAIIFATGFETGSTSTERYGYDIVGRDGLSMREHFADGAKTLHGFFSHGFPNFIELGLSQNAYVVNFTYMLDRKARHAARTIAHARRHGITTIEPDPDSQREWVEATKRTEELRLAYFATCTPGYYNGQGDVSRGFFNDIHNISEIDFWNMIDQWWEAGSFEGLALKSRAAATSTTL
ncbi:flavin-containing monooxygenase [Gordonia terrae]|uniref:NAD(P)/FAD-dependent oxidoreductase n=2 Tax=Gordonia terrae TaxID=2055 RepID=A0AAD0NW73_9ACTN|nr:NAD(P)/FAD-dependent oxidoreductase [Gordonia terrae]VTR09552.1 Phenylacetone monooxygenase [Clostridioides difficile]ANY22170.1 monooxygenase [Gordonia terrae]AWO82912.1 NAD(P)/FAD-dependent oxidoreductase [Gordonia terrae]VTS28963.1 Phenylacetone monooxygenase [Gordonia terrae]GAB46370.1 putative Baeyer-Villiger monooxygenase [Gordonia terrae NBRC 100016]